MKKDKLSLPDSFVRTSLQNRFKEAFVMGSAEITLYNAKEVLEELGFSPSKITKPLRNIMASILREIGFIKCTQLNRWYLPFKNPDYDRDINIMKLRREPINDN